MATAKSFSAYQKPVNEDFQVELTGTNGNTESFTFAGAIPGILMLDFAAGSDTENPASMAGAVRELLEASLIEVDKERFFKFISDQANNIDMEILGELAGYLAEVYVGRPLSS